MRWPTRLGEGGAGVSAGVSEGAWNKEVPAVKVCRLHGVHLWLLTTTEDCEQLCEDLNAFST